MYILARIGCYLVILWGQEITVNHTVYSPEFNDFFLQNNSLKLD